MFGLSEDEGAVVGIMRGERDRHHGMRRVVSGDQAS